MFSGCSTAIITPMKSNGDIDEEGLKELIRFQEENGVDSDSPLRINRRICNIKL